MSGAREKLEAAFAQWLGAKYAFAFWKGRVAMYAILRAFGIGEGDEVIAPGYTCVAVARPIKYVGARPVYVDIEPVTFNIDPAKIEAKLSGKTRLIVAQHTYGYPAEMDAILDIARRRSLPVIEDSCLALGSTYKGRRTGTLTLAAYWSMQWSKTFTTGVGGIATTDDADLAAKIERLAREEAREPGLKEATLLAAMRTVHRLLAFPKTVSRMQAVYRRLSDAGLVAINPPGAEQVQFTPAFFKRLGAAQARAGLRHVRRLDANLAHRRRLMRLYDRLLAERGWPMPRIPDYMDPVLVRYPVRVADKAAAIALAQARRLELGTWFDCPLHQIDVPMETFDYAWGMCPISEKAARETVNLPTHPRVGERLARQVVDLMCEIGPAR
jgi:dTDP-4-amino-4,6-dideoxygalactose transaminase